MGYKLYLVSLSLFVTIIAAQNFQQATQFAAPSQSQQQQSGEQQSASHSDTISASAAPATYISRQYDYSQEEDEDDEPQQQYVRRQHPQQQLSLKQKALKKLQLEEELAEEEPDKLSLLLQKSNFHCDGHATGYYADESLGCEVFHYCQENQKHSWICPEGFTFHQVHLICMPPSGDNICEQSSKYHFVNDYLYKPLNMEEHQSKPNVTLRYSERFYPENFYLDERREYEDDRHSAPRQQYHQQASIRKAPVPQSNYNPTPTPLPYRVAAKQQQQQNVYHTPEEINIPLQKRRPFFSASSTPQYDTEEEYSYEK